MRRRIEAFVVMMLGVMLAPSARADIPAPATACNQKKVGDACTYDNKQGICRDTCADSGTGCVECITGEKDSGCAFGGRAARVVGPWALAGTFSTLLFLLGRRRR
jgi:hypothetical protein